MVIAGEPMTIETTTAMPDGSGSPTLDYPPPDRRPSRGWRLTRWIVGGGILIGLLFSIFVPTMCRAREPSNRIKCSSNLRQIGLAATMFANAHDGVMPANWQELVSGGDITADVFLCPSSNLTDRATDSQGVTWAASLDDPNAHHCSYFYAGTRLRLADLKPEDIIAFEPADDHNGDGVNLLYADGHVDWHGARTASKPVYDRLMADYTAGVRPLRWKD